MDNVNGRIILLADRVGDGTGVSVTLSIKPGMGDGDRSVGKHFLVVANYRTLLQSTGSGAFVAGGGVDDDLRSALDQAINSPYDVAFEVRIEIRIR